MDWIGDVGLIVAVASLVVSVVGLSVVIARNADRNGLIQGLQMVYVGMAGIGLGVTLFVMSQPEAVLTLPFKIASGALLVGVSARILAHVATLRHRSQLPPATVQFVHDALGIQRHEQQVSGLWRISWVLQGCSADDARKRRIEAAVRSVGTVSASDMERLAKLVASETLESSWPADRRYWFSGTAGVSILAQDAAALRCMWTALLEHLCEGLLGMRPRDIVRRPGPLSRLDRVLALSEDRLVEGYAVQALERTHGRGVCRQPPPSGMGVAPST